MLTAQDGRVGKAQSTQHITSDILGPFDMKKNLLSAFLLLALTLFLGLSVAARAESDLDFKLVNKTGYDIKEIYIGPSTSEEWGKNVLKQTLDAGETLDLTFSSKAIAKKWDIKCVYVDGETAQWIGFKLSDIAKITLFWSQSKGSTAKLE
jgi:hypothetical protein